MIFTTHPIWRSYEFGADTRTGIQAYLFSYIFTYLEERSVSRTAVLFGYWC